MFLRMYIGDDGQTRLEEMIWTAVRMPFRKRNWRQS